MPFKRPTLSELRSQAAADITAKLKTADGLLRFSNLGIMGTAVAGLSHAHYGYLDYIAKQATPYTATAEWLEAWAALKKVYREPATYAQLSVTWTATADKTLAAGTEVKRSDGVAYVTLAAATANSAGTLTAIVQAQNAGTDGNAEVGTLITLGSAVAGIGSSGAVVAIAKTAIDLEGDDSLRTRTLAAYQSQARGGSQSDYETWALEVEGVTRTWCNPRGFGPGTAVVYVMYDTVNAANNGFPGGTDGISPSDNRATSANTATGDQLTVADHLFTVQPVTALVYVCSPIAAPQNFTISGLTAPSAALKESIGDAIAQVLLDEGSPMPGSQVNLSSIEAAIAAIAGTSGFVIVGGSNIANKLGYLPMLGGVAYV